MGNSNRLLLVHRRMERVSPEEAVEIMLTPQFYTLKKETLPVRYAYQAKKIAPSLFEGLLEASRAHEYFVYKEEDSWVFIAYDPSEIIDFLEERGVAPEKVSKIYFAQQALRHFAEAPVQLGEKEALTVIDNMVVVVPQNALKDKTFATFSDSFRPPKGIRLEAGTSSVLGRKQAVILAVILSLFALVWMVEGWRYGKKNMTLQTELNTLYEANPALQSAYARESVAEKYRSIDKAQRAKREVIGKVAGLLFKGVTLTGFTLKGSSFTAHFSVSDAQVAQKLKQLVKAAGFSFKNVSATELVVEGRV